MRYMHRATLLTATTLPHWHFIQFVACLPLLEIENVIVNEIDNKKYKTIVLILKFVPIWWKVIFENVTLWNQELFTFSFEKYDFLSHFCSLDCFEEIEQITFGRMAAGLTMLCRLVVVVDDVEPAKNAGHDNEDSRLLSWGHNISPPDGFEIALLWIFESRSTTTFILFYFLRFIVFPLCTGLFRAAKVCWQFVWGKKRAKIQTSLSHTINSYQSFNNFSILIYPSLKKQIVWKFDPEN